METLTITFTPEYERLTTGQAETVRCLATRITEESKYALMEFYRDDDRIIASFESTQESRTDDILRLLLKYTHKMELSFSLNWKITKNPKTTETPKDTGRYLVICQSLHNHNIASIDPFSDYESALEFLQKDVKKTAAEEGDGIELEFDGDTAELKSGTDYTWVWSIYQLPED